MELDNRQREQLQKALISAFPSAGSLKEMVDYGLNENLDSISNSSNYTEIVFSLIRWAQSQGRIEALLKAARARNPGNEQLRIFDEQLQRSSNIKLLPSDSKMMDPDTKKISLKDSIEEKRQVSDLTASKDVAEVPRKQKKAVVSNALLEKLQPDFLKPARRHYSKFTRRKYLLQQSSTLFCKEGNIYPDLCDRTLKSIEDLRTAILKFRASIAELSYPIKVEMNHSIEQVNHLISELRTFRGECPRPPSTAHTLRQHYDRHRQDICNELQMVLSSLNNVDGLLKAFFAQPGSDEKG